jgi:uroporphyrinogen-III synthase
MIGFCDRQWSGESAGARLILNKFREVCTLPAVVLTRQKEDNFSLKLALAQRGVEVMEIPCVAFCDIEAPELKTRVEAITLASRHGVKAFTRLPWVMSYLNKNRPLVAVVGESTAKMATTLGLVVDLVAEPPEGLRMAQMLVQSLPVKSKVAVVSGDLKVGHGGQELLDKAFEVFPVQVYQNVEPDIPCLKPFDPGAVFVASPSAGQRLLKKNRWMKRARFFVIGDTTYKAMTNLGVTCVEKLGTDFDYWVETLCHAGLSEV